LKLSVKKWQDHLLVYLEPQADQLYVVLVTWTRST